jgi:hypothetical protein
MLPSRPPLTHPPTCSHPPNHISLTRGLPAHRRCCHRSYRDDNFDGTNLPNQPGAFAQPGKLSTAIHACAVRRAPLGARARARARTHTHTHTHTHTRAHSLKHTHTLARAQSQCRQRAPPLPSALPSAAPHQSARRSPSTPARADATAISSRSSRTGTTRVLRAASSTEPPRLHHHLRPHQPLVPRTSTP